MLEEYVAVDLEMTGLKASRDRILEIGAVRCQRGEETEKFQVIVNPGIPLPEEIAALTGITSVMAQGGADLRRAMENFLEFWQGLPLVLWVLQPPGQLWDPARHRKTNKTAACLYVWDTPFGSFEAAW